MEYIFIDTSIFESNNFFEGVKINELLKLSEEGHITVVVPIIIEKEIINRIRKNIIEAQEKFNKYRKDTRIFRNIKSLEERFDDIDIDVCLDEMTLLLRNRLRKSNAIIIDYPITNIGIVFDNYFDRRTPFGGGQKKSEFPDAFALHTLENWCVENKATCKVLSNDNDLLAYKSERLEVVVDYEKYLNDKLVEIEEERDHHRRIEKITNEYKERINEFIEEIKNWLNQELDDYSKYYNHVNYRDVYEIDIEFIEVELDDFYAFTSISEKDFTFETYACLEYSVGIITDDEDEAWYDDEDRVWHYMDTKTEKLEDSIHIPISFKYEIPEAGIDFAKIEIYSINNNKSIKI